MKTVDAVQIRTFDMLVGCGYCGFTQKSDTTHCRHCGCPIGLVPDELTQKEIVEDSRGGGKD